jgi:3-phosphoshikimate 1-carboxyvinyltransferase
MNDKTQQVGLRRSVMDAIQIPTPDRPIDAIVEIPGSKSITNRALLTAALGNGTTILTNALFSEDTRWFSTCLQRLGIPVTSDPARAEFQVTGQGGEIPVSQAELFVGNAGTAARFITALVSLAEGEYALDGIPRMRERPLSELLRVLEAMGAELDFKGQPGCMPFTMRSHRFAGGPIQLQAHKTSQQLSALLMIAPYAQEDTIIEVDGTLVSESYINMTLRVMEQFGVQVSRNDSRRFHIEAGQRYRALPYTVEPDASNASYFFAAAAITGGRVRVNYLSKHSCQGDIHFVDVLEAMGCQVTATDHYLEVVGPAAELKGIDVDLNDMSDLVQTLAAIAPFASSPLTIRNVEHIRWKETERIKAVVTELQRLGVEVEEFPDGMRIQPGPVTPAQVQTYNDHRMAMAFAVTGLRVPGIVIQDPACTQKTFPDFFDRFLAMIE